MKPSSTAFLGAALSLSSFLSGVAVAQQRPDPSGQAHTARQADQTFEEQTTTPAQLRIAAAKLQIHANPKKAQAYNELALAFVRRARETANPEYLRDADEALA